VIFAPKLSQGLGIIHPFHNQELEHLAVILYHCTHHTLTGDLIQQSWESFRLELGMPGNLTDFNYALWGECITSSWLKTVWKYCREHSIQITDRFATLTKSRVNDKFLMHTFMLQGYSSKELRLLNQVRNFLRAVTLADITTADGRSLAPGILEGTYLAQRMDKYSWPRQPTQLSKAHTELWSAAVQKCFTQAPYTISKLRIPLGNWLEDPTHAWPWFVRPQGGELYEREGTRWREYQSTRNSCRSGTLFYRTNRTVNHLPQGAKPADVRRPHHRTNDVYMGTYSTHRVQHGSGAPITTPADHWLQNTALQGWATEEVTQH
jgi:hypothetical protein